MTSCTSAWIKACTGPDLGVSWTQFGLGLPNARSWTSTWQEPGGSSRPARTGADSGNSRCSPPRAPAASRAPCAWWSLAGTAHRRTAPTGVTTRSARPRGRAADLQLLQRSDLPPDLATTNSNAHRRGLRRAGRKRSPIFPSIVLERVSRQRPRYRTAMFRALYACAVSGLSLRAVIQ